jgi:hypothetical protein
MGKKYGVSRHATDGNIVWRMRIIHWKTEATDTHSEYVILTAFPGQQCLRERASVLRCTLQFLSC